MLLLPLLVACNPEHSPGDLAQIETLETANTGLTAELASTRAERDTLKDQVESQLTSLEGFMVVGQAWYTASKMPIGAELVVCWPTEVVTDPNGGLAMGVSVPKHSEPWVQPTVSPDCGEPMVLSLIPAPQESAEPLASIGEGYDGPQLKNAPQVEEDPD